MLFSGIVVYKDRRSPAAANRLLETHFPTLFHTIAPYPPFGHLPPWGRLFIRSGEAATTTQNP